MGEKTAWKALALRGPREFGGWNKEADLAEENEQSSRGAGEEPRECLGLQVKGRKSFRKEGVAAVSSPGARKDAE